MLLVSKWQIQLGSLVLLRIGDYVKTEPNIPRAVQNDVSSPLRSPWAIPLRSYNAQHTMEIQRVQVFASDALAWGGALAWLASLPTGVAQPASIIDNAGNSFTLVNCLIAPGATATSESEKLHTNFTLQFGQITVNSLAPPPTTQRILTGSGDRIVTGSGDPIKI